MEKDAFLGVHGFVVSRRNCSRALCGGSPASSPPFVSALTITLRCDGRHRYRCCYSVVHHSRSPHGTSRRNRSVYVPLCGIAHARHRQDGILQRWGILQHKWKKKPGKMPLDFSAITLQPKIHTAMTPKNSFGLKTHRMNAEENPVSSKALLHCPRLLLCCGLKWLLSRTEHKWDEKKQQIMLRSPASSLEPEHLALCTSLVRYANEKKKTKLLQLARRNRITLTHLS